MKTLAAQLIADPYAWPGGYPRYAICKDGGALCQHCVKAEQARMSANDHEYPDDAQWIIAALEINWENQDLTCDHCNKPIECAYGD